MTTIATTIITALLERGITPADANSIPTTIHTFTPQNLNEEYATISYRGEITTGRADDRWGVIEQDELVEDFRCADSFEEMIDAIVDLFEDNFDIVDMEMPEWMAEEAIAARF